MEDQRMTDLLRALPAERASDDFNRRLLARLDEPAASSPHRPRAPIARWAWAAAAAALLLVPLAAKRLTPERRIEPGQARVLLEQIQSEHQQLEHELQALRQLRSEQPVLYLGGDDEVDYVVDLEQVRNVRSDRYNL